MVFPIKRLTNGQLELSPMKSLTKSPMTMPNLSRLVDLAEQS